MTERPWPSGAVTGVGSLPGTDPVEAARLVFGELAKLPHLPELPARGAGADMIGRAAALLVDLPVELVPSGWRITARAGHDLRRARDFLAWDLDALQVAGDGYSGPLKLQAAGPWTLAASLELPNGNRVVSDHGAARDLAASLAEGLTQHLADVRARVPGAVPVLQLDEPSLPAVLAGRVPTPSGFGTVRAVDPAVAEQTLHDVLNVAEEPARVVHCCAADAPIGLLRSAGCTGVSFDATRSDDWELDELGQAVEAGTSLWLGVLPATDAPVSFDAARERVRQLWTALGFPLSQLADSVVATPACGLAGASSEYARTVLHVLRDLGDWLADAEAEQS
ncbi:MAG TPA: methionine synthase [Jatrophihabitans sp.]|nr:methionine synthase [Jatrophihabitans sp.]